MGGITYLLLLFSTTSALLVDPLFPPSPCAQRCARTCTTPDCLSQCQSLLCPSTSVDVFFLLVVALLGVTALAYHLLYSKKVKESMKRKVRRETASHYLSL